MMMPLKLFDHFKIKGVSVLLFPIDERIGKVEKLTYYRYLL